MRRVAFALLLSAGIGGPARSQSPAMGTYPQPPSFGGRLQQSPLSPYLNLLNGGGNPAANYYNFTRPLLQQQQQGPFAQPSAPQGGAFQQQIGFLPPAPLPDYATRDATDPYAGGSLPPTGHPVAYGNRFSGAGSNPPRTGFAPTGGQPTQPSQRPGGAPSIPRAKK